MSFFCTHIIGKEQLPGVQSGSVSVVVTRTKSITLTGGNASPTISGAKGSVTLTGEKGDMNIDES